MKIGDLARLTGLSVHTIRYYEKIGLMPQAHRDDGGRRQYGMEISTWLAFLKNLRTTGMGINDMVRYAELRAEGPSTANARCQMLEAHRQTVLNQIEELTSVLPVLDEKIAIYQDMEKAHIMEAHHARDSSKFPTLTRKHKRA